MASNKRRFTASEALKFVEDSDDTVSYYSSSESELEDEEFPSDSDAGDVTGDEIEDREVGEPQVDVWQRLDTPATEFQHIPFSMNDCGIQIEEEEMPKTVLGYFQLFYSDELLQMIVDNSNANANARLSNFTPKKHSIWNKWANISLKELKAYFGVIFNMAINDKPGIFDYFSTDWVDIMPFFTDVFTRRRFLQIHWILQISTPAVANANRATKVERLVKHVKEKCLQYFHPGPKIAVDETTVAFKGRVAFRMYNPQKPTKWDLRVYVLADSETGYISVFEPYYGNETTEALVRPDLNFTCRIVLELCQQLQSKTQAKGYHLFTDRFYTSFHLAEELLNMGIHLTGTIQKNRQELPAEAKKNEAKTS